MAGRPRKLEREMVVAEAIALLDADGFEGVTLRALAARLNVRAPALYWHFPDRAALLAAMVDALEARVDVPPVPPRRADLFDWICQRGEALRGVLRGLKGSAKLIAAATARPGIGREFEVLVAEVEDITKAELTQVVATLNSFVLGWLHYEQEPTMQEFMSSIMDRDSAYRKGLTAIARGLVIELES